MDALYDVTATESEPLVDDSSNGLSDSSSRTAQSNIIHSVAMQCHLLLPNDVDCLSTNETEDSNFNEFKVSDDTTAANASFELL